MDLNFNKSPGLSLPAPSDEASRRGEQQGDGVIGTKEAGPPTAEARGTIAPATASGAAAAPLAPTVLLQTPVVPAAASINDAATRLASDDDNADALDQEWVDKAKAIVEKTKNDPYVESRELGRVKADFLRTRYNKHIKIVEEHP